MLQESEKIAGFIIKKAKDFINESSVLLNSQNNIDIKNTQIEYENKKSEIIEESETSSDSDINDDIIDSENEIIELKWGSVDKKLNKYKEDVVTPPKKINILNYINNNVQSLSTKNQIQKPIIVHSLNATFWNDIKENKEICLECYYGKNNDIDQSALLVCWENSQIYLLTPDILNNNEAKELLIKIFTSTNILKVFIIYLKQISSIFQEIIIYLSKFSIKISTPIFDLSVTHWLLNPDNNEPNVDDLIRFHLLPPYLAVKTLTLIDRVIYLYLEMLLYFKIYIIKKFIKQKN